MNESTLQRIHLYAAVLLLMIFAATGQWMRHHAPPVHQMEMDARLLYRSRHIYVLMIGLLNLAVGVRYILPTGVWRRRFTFAGSALLWAAGSLLVAAFAIEPSVGQPGPASKWGLYAAFGGALSYCFAVWETRERSAASLS